MPANKLRAFLDGQRLKYVTIRHSAAYTAQEIAALTHIRGKELAKTVIVKVDGKLAMAVVPASRKIEMELLRIAIGAESIGLASEAEFRGVFSDCETGAMPPFGNLYGMPVFVDLALAGDEEIAFNAGSHSELIRMAYADFEQVVRPGVANFTATPRGAAVAR
jgi:Ala-tRNA(Pro) deacylase